MRITIMSFFVFIGAVFQKLQTLIFECTQEGSKNCDGLTLLCYSCWKTNS